MALGKTYGPSMQLMSLETSSCTKLQLVASTWRERERERERDEKAGGQTVVMALILCAAFRCNSASSSPQAGLTPQGSTRHASLVACLLPPLLLLLTLSLHKMLATWHHPCIHLCMQACHEWFWHMQIMGGFFGLLSSISTLVTSFADCDAFRFLWNTEFAP